MWKVDKIALFLDVSPNVINQLKNVLRNGPFEYNGYSSSFEGAFVRFYPYQKNAVYLEFNPSKLTQLSFFYWVGKHLTFDRLKRAYISRIDLALDKFDKINPWDFLNFYFKKTVHISEQGNIETMYFWYSQACLVRIYDKGIETGQELPNRWWRFELQLRGDFFRNRGFQKLDKVKLVKFKKQNLDIDLTRLLKYMEEVLSGERPLVNSKDFEGVVDVFPKRYRKSNQNTLGELLERFWDRSGSNGD